MKIATTTGDFDNYVAAGTDVCEKLQMLADSGFRHIDLNMYQVDFEGSPFVENTWESWAYDIANTGARLGLDFVQAHGSDSAYDAGELRRRRMDMIANELRVCKMLGIPGMVVHAVCRPGFSLRDLHAGERRILRRTDEGRRGNRRRRLCRKYLRQK